VSSVPFTVLESSTFCVSDECGDICEPHQGFFHEDTRFLSRFKLTIDGALPLLLSSGRVDYYSAAFWLRNPVTETLEQDELSISRRRFVSRVAMQEQIDVENHTNRPLTFAVGLELEADFADIFAVKQYDLALGDPSRALPLPPSAVPVGDPQTGELVFVDPGEFPARMRVMLSSWGEVDRGTLRYEVELAPQERWGLCVDLIPSVTGERRAPESGERQFGDELTRVRESLAVWELRVPRLRAAWDDLQHTFGRSVSDLASLRMDVDGLEQLPAAGVPWFMAVFGRDTIITSLQTMLFGPELAETALRALADLQAREDDPSIDAEPGKIVHEVRHGKAAQAWFSRYYGTLDATPLYLILLSEVWRWTDNVELVASLREPALDCLEWIDRYGDLDADGFVEFLRRSDDGLVTQSWKDSWNSQLFADGTLAEAPIAPCEVQGYVYDAKVRTAELARVVWRDRTLADRLEREAGELRDAFDRAFWCEERGGYFALGLDRDKRQIDSLCSNIGHLLWSGIVKPERVDAVVDQLMGESLWSGWGVRTMSAADAGYNPLTYHNGTVWPHDNALIAWGLARYERWPEAHRIIRRMLNAAGYFDHQLPEVFAGFSRSDTPFPIRYPTASTPQAWAAGTPVLLLRILLGLEPDPGAHALKTRAPELPSWAGSLQLRGIRAFERSWDVRLEGGQVLVDEA
jgi:glycogen debranching enzyme